MYDTPVCTTGPASLLSFPTHTSWPYFASLPRLAYAYDRPRGRTPVAVPVCSTHPEEYLASSLHCSVAHAFDTPCFIASLLTPSTPPWAVAVPRGPYLASLPLFPTHTEGGDPGSLHEKKIKNKDLKSEPSNTLNLGKHFT